MNDDHENDLIIISKVYGGLEYKNVSILSIDQYGFDVLGFTKEGKRRTRIGFLGNLPLKSPSELKQRFIDLLKESRKHIN